MDHLTDRRRFLQLGGLIVIAAASPFLPACEPVDVEVYISEKRKQRLIDALASSGWIGTAYCGWDKRGTILVPNGMGPEVMDPREGDNVYYPEFFLNGQLLVLDNVDNTLLERVSGVVEIGWRSYRREKNVQAARWLERARAMGGGQQSSCG